MSFFNDIDLCYHMFLTFTFFIIFWVSFCREGQRFVTDTQMVLSENAYRNLMSVAILRAIFNEVLILQNQNYNAQTTQGTSVAFLYGGQGKVPQTVTVG